MAQMCLRFLGLLYTRIFQKEQYNGGFSQVPLASRSTQRPRVSVLEFAKPLQKVSSAKVLVERYMCMYFFRKTC